MKYRIFSIVLSIIVIFASSFSYCMPVHAVMMGRVDVELQEATVEAWKTGDWSKVTEIIRSNLSIMKAIALGAGAVASGDTLTAISASEAVLDAIPNNVSIDDNGNFVFGADLMSAIKQALKEYQQEQYGYQILPTIKYDQIPVSVFENGASYRSMCELACKYGMIGFLHSTVNMYTFTDFSKYLNGESGFYMYAYGNISYRVAEMDLLTWSQGYEYQFDTYNVPITNTDVLYTWEDVANASVSSGTSFGTWYSTFSGSYLSGEYNLIVSAHGEDILVFNSATSLKNYSVDKRGVFTTSDFYKDTGALTVSIDDLNKSIGDLTDLLEQFKDLIGKQEGGLTEDQLQQLLKEFLDDFFNRLGDNNGGDDDNNGGDTSGGDIDIPDGFFDSIAGYCNSVLAYLESILFEIQNLEFLTWESNIDEEHSDLSDMFDKIWDDPETGSQEVADELSMSFSDLATGMTKKFPFSIPWDVYALFTVFADVNPPQTYGMSAYSLESDGIQPLSNEDMEEHNAPYFELPIVLESYGINESIKVDLEPFTPVSTLSRTMLSLLFGVFLMKFTIKIIDLFKGGTDT